MTRRTTLISTFLPLLLLGACAPSGSGNGSGGSNGSGSGGSSNSGSGGSNGSGGSSGACNSKVTANESNDYMFSSTLQFPTVDVKPKTNLTVDWSELSKDFEMHSLDPKKDINQVLFIDWMLKLSDLETSINNDEIGNTYEGLPLKFVPDGNTTSAKVYDFGLATGGTVMQSDIDNFLDIGVSPSSTHTFTVIAATGSQLGAGTRMIQSFVLNNSSSNDTVKIKDDSTMLQFTANLHQLTPTNIPSGQSGVSLDWGKMKTNAMGRTFDTTQITHALVGKYSQSISDLESNQFLNLEMIADELYEGDIASGTVVDFSKLKDSSGKSFSGIDGNGTWLIALICGMCHNPAPWYLTVLKPCSN